MSTDDAKRDAYISLAIAVRTTAQIALEAFGRAAQPLTCPPDCTPAAPCWRLNCPMWREQLFFNGRACHNIEWERRRVAPLPVEWPPPAQPHAPPDLRHGGLCIASWNGRAPKQAVTAPEEQD